MMPSLRRFAVRAGSAPSSYALIIACLPLTVWAHPPFHGAAHWDAALAGAVLAFALGLLLCTAGLHAAGVFAAVTLKGRPLWLRLAAAPVALAGMGMLLARTA